MPQPQKTALLAGATGLIGRHVLQYLLNNSVYSSVAILVRKEIPMSYPKLKQHIVDFDRLSASASLIKADDVYCCLGTTIKKAGSQANFKKVDLEYPFAVAEGALKNGARQFLLVTAMGADKSSLIFYNRVKGEVESAVNRLPYKAIHIFRPSLLLGERAEHRAGEKIGTAFFNIAAPLFIGPLAKYKAIEGRAVAGAMVACAKSNASGIFIHESNDIQKIFDQSSR